MRSSLVVDDPVRPGDGAGSTGVVADLPARGNDSVEDEGRPDQDELCTPRRSLAWAGSTVLVLLLPGTSALRSAVDARLPGCLPNRTLLEAERRQVQVVESVRGLVGVVRELEDRVELRVLAAVGMPGQQFVAGFALGCHRLPHPAEPVAA